MHGRWLLWLPLGGPVPHGRGGRGGGALGGVPQRVGVSPLGGCTLKGSLGPVGLLGARALGADCARSLEGRQGLLYVIISQQGGGQDWRPKAHHRRLS